MQLADVVFRLKKEFPNISDPKIFLSGQVIILQVTPAHAHTDYRNFVIESNCSIFII